MTRRALTEPELAPKAGLGSSLDWALGHAGRTPSELNSQPWRHTVHLRDDGTAIVELGLDRSRRLPHVDPDDREAVLACGAWLLNLRLALVAVGLVSWVEVVSDAEQPDLLGRCLDARYAVEQPATVVVLGSPEDDRPSLLRVGAGMQRLLLRATALGLAASYRKAALHVPELRRELGRVVQLDHPQVVLRLGLGTGAPTTGRLEGTR